MLQSFMLQFQYARYCYHFVKCLKTASTYEQLHTIIQNATVLQNVYVLCKINDYALRVQYNNRLNYE